MTALTAVALSGLFTGCSKEMETNGETTAEADIIQTYENAFITRFGQPHENQTWGFGSVAGTRVENANANEWADPNKAYGGLKVPPPLTDAQKAVVIEYFQTVRNPTYEDPHWTNYFIQQVYKGHTAPREGYSPEAYLAANGSTYLYASDYMDHLAAIDGDFVDHINNFNHGDCSTNETVLDNGGNANDGPFHSDKIMYMKESTTASFGYYNSNGSVRRTEYTGLVGFQTIINVLGSKANCLNDGWNRSFMGFDFEQMVGDEIYAKIGWGDNANDWAYYEYGGQKYHYLSSNMNMYCGDLKEYNDLNGVNIAKLLSDGYLPVAGSADKKWVKVGGCADGYYSDWIVTLTKANTGNTPPPPPSGFVCRIIAEDLTVGENSDFDFNDVVFDVIDNGATIRLRAAGGELPLYVAGQEVHDAFATKYPGITRSTLVNTGWRGSSLDYYNYYVDIPSGGSYSTLEACNDIPVIVTKRGSDHELKNILLTARVGKVASKVCVGIDYLWCAEREDIDSKYHKADGTKLFHQYVIGQLGADWYQQK